VDDLSRWEIGVLAITTLVVGFVFSRVGLLGLFVATLWIPLVGVTTMLESLRLERTGL